MTSKHVASTLQVDQIWFHGQRVIRTLVQTGVPAFVGFVGVLPAIIDALGLPVDGVVYAALVGAAAALTAVAGALSRVMAIPGVNEFLTRIGIGSVPKTVAKRQAVAAQVGIVAPAQILDGSDRAGWEES